MSSFIKRVLRRPESLKTSPLLSSDPQLTEFPTLTDTSLVDNHYTTVTPSETFQQITFMLSDIDDQQRQAVNFTPYSMKTIVEMPQQRYAQSGKPIRSAPIVHPRKAFKRFRNIFLHKHFGRETSICKSPFADQNFPLESDPSYVDVFPSVGVREIAPTTEQYFRKENRILRPLPSLNRLTDHAKKLPYPIYMEENESNHSWSRLNKTFLIARAPSSTGQIMEERDVSQMSKFPPSEGTIMTASYCRNTPNDQATKEQAIEKFNDWVSVSSEVFSHEAI